MAGIKNKPRNNNIVSDEQSELRRALLLVERWKAEYAALNAAQGMSPRTTALKLKMAQARVAGSSTDFSCLSTSLELTAESSTSLPAHQQQSVQISDDFGMEDHQSVRNFRHDFDTFCIILMIYCRIITTALNSKQSYLLYIIRRLPEVPTVMPQIAALL